MRLRDIPRRVRLVYKRSSRLTKICVCSALTIALVSVLWMHAVTLNGQSEADYWREKAQQLEQENQQLEDKIDNLGTDDSIKDIAKEELGLEDPDTVIITPGK